MVSLFLSLSLARSLASPSPLSTAAQVRRILSHYKYVPTSAEAFVIIFRRTIDWHGLASILFDLPPVREKSPEYVTPRQKSPMQEPC